MGHFVIGNTCMVMLLMGIDHLSGSVQPIMGPQHLFIDIKATRSFFHVGIQDRQLVVIPGIHYFDVHRLQPDLLNTMDRRIDPGSMNFASPEGAGDTVNDLSSDEEAASTDDESDPEDPTVAWCPPVPDAAEDPSEDENRECSRQAGYPDH